MISSVELYRWMNTYGALIKTARITQLYRTGKSELWWALHTKEGKKFLFTAPPEVISLTDEKQGEHKETGFGRWMRDNIKGAIIENITQVGSDRVLNITARRGPMIYDIFIELYAQGNIIVCLDKKILVCLEKRSDVEKGKIYEPTKQFDSFHATDAEIEKHLSDGEEMTASKALATQLGLGGAFAQEICTAIGVDEQAPKEVLLAKPLANEIKKILDKPTTLTSEKYIAKKEKVVENKKLKKIQTIIEQQTKQKERMLKEIDEFTKVGEYIYNNYAFFEEAIQEYAKGEVHIETLKQKHGITTKITYKKPTLDIEF
jgi:predicted ribosome quality control (RQC) complex YloA/Tae2 family protein